MDLKKILHEENAPFPLKKTFMQRKKKSCTPIGSKKNNVPEQNDQPPPPFTFLVVRPLGPYICGGGGEGEGEL